MLTRPIFSQVSTALVINKVRQLRFDLKTYGELNFTMAPIGLAHWLGGMNQRGGAREGFPETPARKASLAARQSTQEHHKTGKGTH